MAKWYGGSNVGEEKVTFYILYLRIQIDLIHSNNSIEPISIKYVFGS